MKVIIDPTASTDSSNQRNQEIRASQIIYCYSIKQEKIIKLTKNDFKQNLKCQFCVPIYLASKGLVSFCDDLYKSFSALKEHILTIEKKLKRLLIWTKESQIPDLDCLKRVRELGDLNTFMSEPILKIKFDNFTIVNNMDKILNYFKQEQCPCSDDKNSKCKIQIYQTRSIFSHLSYLEKRDQKYLVFKGTVDELTNDESNPFNITYNNSTSNTSLSNKSSTISKSNEQSSILSKNQSTSNPMNTNYVPSEPSSTNRSLFESAVNLYFDDNQPKIYKPNDETINRSKRLNYDNHEQSNENKQTKKQRMDNLSIETLDNESKKSSKESRIKGIVADEEIVISSSMIDKDFKVSTPNVKRKNKDTESSKKINLETRCSNDKPETSTLNVKKQNSSKSDQKNETSSINIFNDEIDESYEKVEFTFDDGIKIIELIKPGTDDTIS